MRQAGQWSAHVFITFQEGPSGGEPVAGLTRDHAGNLYGTTVFGGNQGCYSGFDVGCGVVFTIDPSGTAVLYAFPPPGGADGRYPQARVILDRKDNIYGTTTSGGNESCTSSALGGECFRPCSDVLIG